MIKVGVFMGGKGIEREVSFNSGRTVFDHLDTAHYQALPIFQTQDGSLYILPWSFLHRGKISDFEQRLPHEAEKIRWSELKTRIDFMYLAVHGHYAEDGTLQGMLELLNIPYLGSKVAASALSMDKHMQKIILHNAGIRVPHGITLSPHIIKNFSSDDDVLSLLKEKNLHFPLIIKPAIEGSSLGVSVLLSAEDNLCKALKDAALINQSRPQNVIIEEYLQGMEFSCILITDLATQQPIALPPTEIKCEDGSLLYDYEQKYMPGRAHKFTPARCTNEQMALIQTTCSAAMKALGLTNCARIDGFLMPDNTVVITDPNSLSGMAPASYFFTQAAEINMSHTAVINHLIKTELQAYAMDNDTTTAMTSTTKKMRVAVLMGGNSNEREISLESGRNITYKLSPQTYDVFAIFVNSKNELYILNQKLLVRSSTKEIEALLNETKKIEWDELPELVDFVFLGLHGGEGENGTIQGALEMLGLAYNGSGVLASSLCMDKYKTTQILKAEGLEVPEGILVNFQEWRTQGIKKLPSFYPLIVKPHDDGCSVLVHKVHNDEQLTAALTSIFATGKTHALIEECITGMELTVGVIGNNTAQALPPSRAVASGDILSITEKFLPGAGENLTPAPLPHDVLHHVQETMQRVYTTMGCKGYARIDCFYQPASISPTGKDRVVTIEINTLPGMTPATCLFHQAAEIGLKAMDLIDIIIKLGMELHRPQTSEYFATQDVHTNKTFIASIN